MGSPPRLKLQSGCATYYTAKQAAEKSALQETRAFSPT